MIMIRLPPRWDASNVSAVILSLHKKDNVSVGFECSVGRSNHGFQFFCIQNETIPTKPVSDALKILVDIVHS